MSGEYWKNVSEKDSKFMEKMIEYVKTDPEAKKESDGLGNIDDLLVT